MALKVSSRIPHRLSASVVGQTGEQGVEGGSSHWQAFADHCGHCVPWACSSPSLLPVLCPLPSRFCQKEVGDLD